MNKIRVIDLLNKIANGEEVPKKIKYEYKKFEFIEGAYEDEKGNDLCYYDNSCRVFLDDEVEIIEEEKKIPEKLDYCEENTFMEQKETTYLSSKERRLLDSNFKELGNKINSIIDYLKSKGE